MVGAADEMVGRWGRTGPRERRIDIAAEMTEVTLDVVCRTLFSIKFDGRFRALHGAMAESLREIERRIWSPLSAPFSWPTIRNRKLRRNVSAIHACVDGILADRRDCPDRHDDFLSMIFASADPGAPAAETYESIRTQALGMLIAGHETTGERPDLDMVPAVEAPEGRAPASRRGQGRSRGPRAHLGRPQAPGIHTGRVRGGHAPLSADLDPIPDRRRGRLDRRHPPPRRECRDAVLLCGAQECQILGKPGGLRPGPVPAGWGKILERAVRLLPLRRRAAHMPRAPSSRCWRRRSSSRAPSSPIGWTFFPGAA